MLGRISSTVARQGLRSFGSTNTIASVSVYNQQLRTFSEASTAPSTARDAWNRSCYVEMDFTIHEESMVDDVVKRFSAYDIGCLVTVNSEGTSLSHFQIGQFYT